MTKEEIAEQVKLLGQPAYRAGQIYSWLYRGVGSFEEMTDLPRGFCNELKELFFISKPVIIGKQEARTDGTLKYLWELRDKNCIESVLMRYKHGNTVCISTQVGCKMGCLFCASSSLGFVRNLSASEMIDQVLFTAKDSGLSINNIVLMGIGEPLDNFDNVIRFLKLANEGLGIGMRHISISTCGIPGGIDRLAQENLQVTLSISLHAPDDATRSRIMPVAKSLSVKELMDKSDRYFRRTGRRVSFEYAMINGVNDSPEHARALAALLKGRPAHLNIIPLNDIPGSPLSASPRDKINDFTAELKARNINVTVRRRMGEDIDAACGQLRRKHSL